MCERRWRTYRPQILDEPAFLKPVLLKLPEDTRQDGKDMRITTNVSMK